MSCDLLLPAQTLALEMLGLAASPHALGRLEHTLPVCPAATARFLAPPQINTLTRDTLGHVWMIVLPSVSPSPIAPFSSCLTESDSDAWLHSKVGHPVVLSLQVNQKVSYPLLPTAHLRTNILACFSPRCRRDKMSAPRGGRLSTHTHMQKHTLRRSHSSPNVC